MLSESVPVATLVTWMLIGVAVVVALLWAVRRLQHRMVTATLDGLDEAVLILGERDVVEWASVEASRLFGPTLRGRYLAELLVDEPSVASPSGDPANTVRMICERGEVDVLPRWGSVPWSGEQRRSLILRELTGWRPPQGPASSTRSDASRDAAVAVASPEAAS